MSRPRMFAEPLTAAERMRRYRCRAKASRPQPTTQTEALRGMTKKQQAAFFGCSVRHMHHHRTISENTLIKWDADVMDGKHGKVGMSFIAEVCVNATQDIQQRINDTIKSRSAAAGRALWSELLREDRDNMRTLTAGVASVLRYFIQTKRNDVSAQAIAHFLRAAGVSVDLVDEAIDSLRASGEYERIISR
jgi:hypothetical protein